MALNGVRPEGYSFIMKKITAAALVALSLWPAGLALAQTEDKFMNPTRRESGPGESRSSGDCDRSGRRSDDIGPCSKDEERPTPGARPATTEKEHMNSASSTEKARPVPCEERKKRLIDAAGLLAARLASRI